MGTYEDFDFIIRLIFIFLLWPFSTNWQQKILPQSTLCYVNGLLPVSSSGDLDFVLLNQLNWGLLPIEQLWPVIRNNPVSGPFLLDHCQELSYDQVRWVAKNDPLNRAILLTNHECMSKVSLRRMDLEDFRSLFEELPIYSVSDLESISEDVIVEGLARISYRFPSRDIQEGFLSRLPLRLLKNRSILSKSQSLHLFSVNYLFKEPSSALAYSTFLFQMKWASRSLLWRICLLDLIDLIEHQPSLFLSQSIKNHCNQYLHENPSIKEILTSPETDNSNALFRALQLRDRHFFTSLGSAGFIELFGAEIGAFDQFRIISLLLPDNFDTFNDFFEVNLFDDAVLKQFFKAKPEIVEIILPMAPPQLLRFLGLKWTETLDTKILEPISVPHAAALDFHQLATLQNQISHRFPSPNFRIKYVDDAVVDLGGPLLDWITGILQRILDLGLFTRSVGFEADARDFLDVRFFKLIGLLHGKLVQIGSKPAWIPVITGALLKNVASLVEYVDDPAEAVRLFNEFGFPGLSCPEPFRLCSHVEIQLYLTRITKLFNAWKSRAWEQYYIGLNVFLSDRIPRNLIHKILSPMAPATAAQIAAKTQIKRNPELPHNLHEIWLQVLESLSPNELVKLLIFTTGHCQLTTISLHFIVREDQRLPFARTCFQKLYLYLTDPTIPHQALIEYLTESLRTSIHNYQGFGNI